jgi:hypothetical protein
MSIVQVCKCDGCGSELKTPPEVVRFSGNLCGEIAAASGVSVFHTCSPACAVKTLRAAASALESAAKKAAEDAKTQPAARA